MTDAQGATTTYGYNNRGLVTSIVYGAAGGAAQTESVTFDYDGAGNRRWMILGTGLDRVDYIYSALSRLESETRRLRRAANSLCKL